MAVNFYTFSATSCSISLSHPSMIDDRALVSQVIKGDLQAFRLLIEQHERLVLHMIGRIIKNEADREELCQDVFLKVYEKLATFSFNSRLSTWIATIAYRLAINRIRKVSGNFSDIPDEDRFNERFIETETPENVLESKDTDEFVMRLVEELPVQYKTILTLYHVEGMTYPEICTVTNLPEGTVKSYLFRARNLLKERVKRLSGKEEIL